LSLNALIRRTDYRRHLLYIVTLIKLLYEGTFKKKKKTSLIFKVLSHTFQIRITKRYEERYYHLQIMDEESEFQKD